MLKMKGLESSSDNLYQSWLPFKTVLAQCLLSTSVFSYVYFASVAAAFLFYCIDVCFGDFM